ncbi:MAG: R3H domain-containing nucleic acid-binding protein [bacterium]|nr:R3H domain-containing nucleic acid-binding protein [bacterium]
MTEEDQQNIKDALRSILDFMEIQAEIETRVSDETLVFNLKTEDSSLLIGQHGGNLAALQYLTRILSYKKLSEPAYFIVDVEGYKQEREEFLRELAQAAAERVRDTKESLLLKPMSSYERRVVHAEISKLPDIMTESVGEEPERRIRIKLKS